MHEERIRDSRRREKVRGTIGVFKRVTSSGSTKYDVQYVDSDGKTRWRVTESLREAKLLRAELVSKVGRGERIVPTKVALSDYIEQWLETQEARLRPKTYEGYSNALRLHVKPRLGNRRLQAVTVDDVAALIGSMTKGERYVEKDGVVTKTSGKPFAAWTIRGTLVALGRVYASATRAGLAASNPVRLLDRGERPAKTRREFPSLDVATIGRLIAATPDRYRVIVALSVLTGIRQGEALGLVWGDVDVKTGVIRISRQLDRHQRLVEPKTAAAKREIPIPPSLGRMLSAHKAKAFEQGRAKAIDFVFTSPSGRPMHYGAIVRQGLAKAIKAAGLPHLSWHDLRHVAASSLISQGVSVAYLSRVLGHASPAITLSTYAHEFARAEHDDRTREQMEQAFGGLLG